MLDEENVSRLRKLGLNQYEAQAYLALAMGGANTAGEISATGKIARPRVYDVLEKLQEKGFVALKSGRPVKYSAIPIAEALKTLKKYKENWLFDELRKIDEIGDELSNKMDVAAGPSKFAVEENVWTLKGRHAIYSRIAEMVSKCRENVVVAAPPDSLVRKVKENLKHFEAARERGAKIHFVSNVSKIQDKRHPLHSPNSPVSRLPHSVVDRALPTRMVLADDEALIFLTPHDTPAEEEVGLWVSSPHLVSTLKGLASK